MIEYRTASERVAGGLLAALDDMSANRTCAAAAERIRILEAESAVLRSQRDAAWAELRTADEFTATLAEALEPFAEAAEWYDDMDLVEDDTPLEGLFVGQCRRARAVLKGEPQ